MFYHQCFTHVFPLLSLTANIVFLVYIYIVLRSWVLVPAQGNVWLWRDLEKSTATDYLREHIFWTFRQEFGCVPSRVKNVTFKMNFPVNWPTQQMSAQFDKEIRGPSILTAN